MLILTSGSCGDQFQFHKSANYVDADQPHGGSVAFESAAQSFEHYPSGSIRQYLFEVPE